MVEGLPPPPPPPKKNSRLGKKEGFPVNDLANQIRCEILIKSEKKNDYIQKEQSTRERESATVCVPI